MELKISKNSILTVEEKSLSYHPMQLEEVEKKLNDAKEFIEQLEEENHRLNKINENTLKIKFTFDNCYYEADTQIPRPLKEMEYYWLADDYKNPTRVKLIGYNIGCGIDNKMTIGLSCVDDNGKWGLYNPSSLFKTKNKASDEYLRKDLREKNRAFGIILDEN